MNLWTRKMEEDRKLSEKDIRQCFCGKEFFGCAEKCYACEDKMVEEQDSDRGCYVPISPALTHVNRLLKQRDDLAELCGQILATIRIPANQSSKISDLTELADKWQKEYEVATDAPQRGRQS